MYIQNAYYNAIPVTGATFPLAAGTIVTANGTVPASSDDYYGIVPFRVDKMPTTGYLFVAVSGTIDLDTCGVTFTDAQIKALGADFNFVRAAEIAEPAPELPTVSAVDNGKVLTVVNGAWAAASGGSASGLKVTLDTVGTITSADKTYSEIKASIDAGIMPVFVMEASAGGLTSYVPFTLLYLSDNATDTYVLALLDPQNQTDLTLSAESATGTLSYNSAGPS